MKAKTRMDGDKLKGFTIEIGVVESLILSEALTDYAKDRENNAVNRLIALQMSSKMVGVVNDSEKPNNSTISEMEQVDKDTNVRSKDGPQTVRSNLEPFKVDEPQTEPTTDCSQTDCAWK